MIELKNVSKSYGKTRVLRNIDLKLEDGKIYGLLGRNGVGKTSLLNLIANQIRPDGGDICLDGQAIFENPDLVSQLSIVKEEGLGVDDIRVSQLLKAASILYKDWDESYKGYLVKEFKLDIKKKFKHLSRGNQTLVGLVIGLASRARFTMFDEPSLGLDAAHRDRFYSLILEDIEKNPRTIIISTHLIDEVSNLFEEIIILKDEEVFIQEEVPSLLEKAYYLSGREEDILALVDKDRIIHREDFGPRTIFGVFDGLGDGLKGELKSRDIEISQIPLQKLFIYLTENSLVKEAI